MIAVIEVIAVHQIGALVIASILPWRSLQVIQIFLIWAQHP